MTNKILLTQFLAIIAFALLKGQTVFINEVHYDNMSTDTLECIEIAGPAGTNLINYSIALYNGSNQLVYDTYIFENIFLPDQQSGFGTIHFCLDVNGIQNGAPDGIALVDSSGKLIQFISYEGSFTAADGPALGVTSNDIGVNETSSTESGFSLQLSGSGTVYQQFIWANAAENSFGQINNNQNFGNNYIPLISINELRIDQPSSDTDEYLELKGSPGTSLSGLSYIIIGDGSESQGSGVIEAEINLDGLLIQNDSLLLLAEESFSISNADAFVHLSFENNDNTSHFIVYNYSGNIGNDIDTNDDGILDIFPWEMVVDEISIVVDSVSGDLVYSSNEIIVPENTEPGHFYKDCNDTWMAGDFSLEDGNDTPGEPNYSQTTALFAYIHDIQGYGLTSPLVDSVRTIEGIVTASYLGSDKLNGFFIQEEDKDADTSSLTSEGIFVYAPELLNNIKQGDLVRLTGTVAEYYTLTQIKNLKQIEIISSNMEIPIPQTLKLPFDSANWPEHLEGMYIKAKKLTVVDNYNLARYGELALSNSKRLMIPTQVAMPGVEAHEIERKNLLNKILLDDSYSIQNPDPILFPYPELSAYNTLRSGYMLKETKGIMGYSFGEYIIYPIGIPEFSENDNPRTDYPPVLPGTLKIASFNVLNYFNGNGFGGGFPTSRGANTYEEFKRQREKIIHAIFKIDADIIGLMEIENDGYGENSAIYDLVRGLNELAGEGTYDFINPGSERIGTDEISVGLIYKTTSSEPISKAMILDSSIDTQFIDTMNRPSLAQSFKDLTSFQTFTVAVNHFKSKGSDCNEIGDPDMLDGQGNCNKTRKEAAVALIQWLDNDPTNIGNRKSIIIGDLNSYAMEDPIREIENNGFTNLIKKFNGDSAYSYVYSGQHGYLDHALASNEIIDDVRSVIIWNINAAEPRALDYNTEYKTEYQIASLYSNDAFRSSDHDPVIIGLELTPLLRLKEFTLIDAATNNDILKINSNDTINLAQLGLKRVNIRADIDSTAHMVLLEIEGRRSIRKISKKEPYLLFNKNGKHNFGTHLPTGTYTLHGVPIAKFENTFKRGIEKTIAFTIVNEHYCLKSTDNYFTLKENKSDTDVFNNLNVYPNPFSDKIEISLEEEQEVEIIIFNSIGRRVFSGKTNNRTISLELEHLSEGIYFMKLSSSNQMKLIKIVKK